MAEIMFDFEKTDPNFFKEKSPEQKFSSKLLQNLNKF